MSKPQWKIDVEQKEAELQDLFRTAHTYAGDAPSVGLYDVYVRIGKKVQEITDLCHANIPL